MNTGQAGSPAAGAPLSVGARVALVAAVLAAEHLALSLMADGEALSGHAGLVRWVAGVGAVGPLALAIASALFLRGVDPAWCVPRTAPGWLVLHVAALALVVALTRGLFSGGLPASGELALGWFASAAVASGSLPAALLGLRGGAIGAALAAALGVIVLGMAAWLAGLGTSTLWHTLAPVTLVAVVTLLRALGVAAEVELADNVVTVGEFAVEIAPECSGYEGIGLAVVLTSGALYLARHEFRFPLALVLIPVAAVIAWVGNVGRLAALMLVGSRLSIDLALGGFHSKAGWLFFCVGTFLLAVWARRSNLLAKGARADEWEHPAAPFVLPLVALVGAGLATGAFSEAGIDWAYGVRIPIALLVLFRYRHALPSLRPSALGAPVAVGLGVALVWLIVPPPGEAGGVPTELASAPGALRVGWAVLRVLGAALVVPVCEELAFRGYLLRRLTSPEFDRVRYQRVTPIAVAVSSVIFGILHERWLVATAAGVAYALVARRRGRLGDALLAHGLTNATITGFALLAGDWRHLI